MKPCLSQASVFCHATALPRTLLLQLTELASASSFQSSAQRPLPLWNHLWSPTILGPDFYSRNSHTLCFFNVLISLSLSPYTCAEFQSSLRFILGIKVPVREHDIERMMNELKNIPVLFLIFLSWRKKYPFFPSKLWQRLFLLLFTCKGNNLNG